jgi:hypothetical protein
MTKCYRTSAGSREWTKEKMVAYLDWDETEQEWIEASVLAEIGNSPLGSER